MTTPNNLRTNLKNCLLHTAMETPEFARRAQLQKGAIDLFLNDARSRSTQQRVLRKIEAAMLALGWIRPEEPQMAIDDVNADEPNPPILVEPLLLTKEERRYVLRAVCRMDHAENIREAPLDKLIP